MDVHVSLPRIFICFYKYSWAIFLSTALTIGELRESTGLQAS